MSDPILDRNVMFAGGDGGKAFITVEENGDVWIRDGFIFFRGGLVDFRDKRPEGSSRINIIGNQLITMIPEWWDIRGWWRLRRKLMRWMGDNQVE